MAGRAGEPQPVLLRPGLGALVGPDPLAVLGEPDSGEETAASQAGSVGSGVVLLERPDLRVVVADEGAVGCPLLQQLRGVHVGVATAGVLRQVELDDVVRRAAGELGPLGIVDHVVGRGNDVRERSDLAEVVVERVNWTDLCHERDTLDSRASGRGAAW